MDKLTTEEILTITDMATTIESYATLCIQLQTSINLTEFTKKQLAAMGLMLQRFSLDIYKISIKSEIL